VTIHVTDLGHLIRSEKARSSINTRFLASLVLWCFVVGLSSLSVNFSKALLVDSIEDRCYDKFTISL